MKRAALGVALLLGIGAVVYVRRGRERHAAERIDAPKQAPRRPRELAAAPLPAPMPPPPLTKVVSTERPVDKSEMKNIEEPKGYSAERAYLPKRWNHPMSLAAALKANPALSEKIKQRAPEFAGMLDFKLHWLPRFATCIGDRVQPTGSIAIDFRFEAANDDEMWIGRTANVTSELPEDEEAIVLKCVAKTFVGVERPIMDPNHGEADVFKTYVRFPVDQDGIYDYIR